MVDDRLPIELKTLNQVIISAESIVTKSYLESLEEKPLASTTAEIEDIDIAKHGCFYKLNRLVLNQEENFLQRLTTVVNVVHSLHASLATIIHSDGDETKFYWGVIDKLHRKENSSDRVQREAIRAAFGGALTGNFIGSRIEELSESEREGLHALLERPDACYGVISGVVALRDENDMTMESYVQGLENLVDSLHGERYTLVIIADSIGNDELRIMKRGYEEIYTELAALFKSELTLSSGSSITKSSARSRGTVQGISQGIAMTQNRTISSGYSEGTSSSSGLGLIVSVSNGRSTNATTSFAQSVGRTDTMTKSEQRSHTDTITQGYSDSTGKNLQLHFENRTARSMLELIDKQLERLGGCESYGAFDCAAYVIADTKATALAVASNYQALMRGRNSATQVSKINLWDKTDQTKVLASYIGALTHPRFEESGVDGTEKVRVTPATVSGGNEVAIQVAVPKKSIVGVTVVPMAPFGRNVRATKNGVTLGRLFHMGRAETGNVASSHVTLDVNSLAMHTFVTGSTGAGKSTAIYRILDELRDKRQENGKPIHFMAIEPAKGEYKNRFADDESVQVYGTNEQLTPLLRLNPFSFPPRIHVTEHIDRLIELFTVCWPMYAAMPAVLKDAIEQAYIAAGWNLKTSVCRYALSEGVVFYPTFEDVLYQVQQVMKKSAYSSDSKSDYIGALCTRLRSLTNGVYRQIFMPDELDGENLFEQNVIVDISRIGSAETKALLMGLLIIKLQEYRMSKQMTTFTPLQHVTVLEEAHHILRRTSIEQSAEGSNLLGKSVEMLANAIAEMRSYGEGFIIADQSPGLMDLSVIRNTNTKLILRLPDEGDRELVGRAAGLTDDQIRELARLDTLVGAVYQNDWTEAVLCKVERVSGGGLYKKPVSPDTDEDKRLAISRYLLLPKHEKLQHSASAVDQLVRKLSLLPITMQVKQAFLRYTKTTDDDKACTLRQRILYGLWDGANLIDAAGEPLDELGVWYERMQSVLHSECPSLTRLEIYEITLALIAEQTFLEQTDGVFFRELLNSKEVLL